MFESIPQVRPAQAPRAKMPVAIDLTVPAGAAVVALTGESVKDEELWYF